MDSSVAEVFSRRRQRLADSVGDLPIVLAGGWERLRNPSNTWPFRTESHVLYLMGQLPPGAFITILPQGTDAAEARLYLEPVSLDDAVWSGSGEPWPALELRTGATVHPLSELKAYIQAVGQEKWASLPVQDPRAQGVLEDLLDRRLDIKSHDNDRRLALGMVQCRLVHDAAAQRELKDAGKRTVEAHLAGLAVLRPGQDECDVHAEMMRVAYGQGGNVSFAPIISQASERLHQPAIGGELQPEALLLVDFGVENAAGWAGDVTNTWPVSGRFTPRQRELFDIVVQAYNECVAMLKPGVRYRCVHMHAAKVLTKGLVRLGILKGEVDQLVDRDAHALFFVHGIGHLLGLDVHDMEDLGDFAGYQEGRVRSTRFGLNCLRLDRDLQAGMALTIEPGLYFIPELLDNQETRAKYRDCVDWQKVEQYRGVRGIRFERDFLITETGAECLNPGLPGSSAEVELVYQQLMTCDGKRG